MFVLRITMEKMKKELDQMFVFEKQEHQKEKNELEMQVKKLEQDLEYSKRQTALKVDEEVNKLRQEMSQRLIESDLLRNEAKAKLEVYEKMDTKADANVIKDMLGRLIDSIGKKQDISIIK